MRIGVSQIGIIAAMALAVPTASAASAAEAAPIFGGGIALPGLTLAPTVALPGWSFRGAIGGLEPDAAGWRHFEMRSSAEEGRSVLDSYARFADAPDGAISAQWRLKPSADADVLESGVSSDIPDLAGGHAELDGKSLPLALDGAKPHLFRGAVSNLALFNAGGEEVLRCAFASPTRILLQDGACWGGSRLTLRIYFSEGPLKKGVECVIDATLSTPTAGPLLLGPTRTVRIVPGPDWTPLNHEPWIEPGSALDFSSIVPHHVPAGRSGRVVAVGGHFEFENLPGVPQRFYGVNLCGTANLPETREQADRFAANLVRIGYNAVRIHHHERHLVQNGEALSRGAGALSPAFDGTVLQAGQMAKFDLLVAACVEHGLYITTDLFVSRSHATTWRSLGIDRDGTVPPRDFKLLVAFHEPAFSNLCAWTRNFLGHVNPHTGRSLAQEPALCTLALVNEGNLGNWGAEALRDIPGVAEAWCGPLPTDVNDPAFAVFLAERETALFERLKAFVRDECDCRAPLSSLSAWYNPVQYQIVRTHFDYVDDHFYVDHPAWLGATWRLPSRCSNVNPLLGPGRGAQASEWRRLMDKPFCISEFNYSGPGRFRGVGGIATGALAALQDWSGLWRFAWSHSLDGIVNPGGAMDYFNVANDPLTLAAERAGLCLFLRGDLAPLEEAQPAIFSEAALREPNAPQIRFPGPDQPLALGWKARVGTIVASAGTVSGAQNSDKSAVPPAPSDGGTATVSPDGTLLIDTPLTVGGFAESGSHQAGPLRFYLAVSGEAQNTPATIWASSLDGKPIASSSHMLLTHITDVQNSGVEYADPGLTILLANGKLPHLMRNGAAEIELTIAGRDGHAPQDAATHAWHVWRLSPSGRRLGEVPVNLAVSSEAQNTVSGEARNTLRFTARTDYDPTSATFLYEIAASTGESLVK